MSTVLLPAAASHEPDSQAGGWPQRLLGADRRTRKAFLRTLMASAMCLVWTGVEVWAWLQGIVPPAAFAGMIAFNACGLLAFNVAVRSGWSLRFADVGLTQYQMIFAMLCMCWTYVFIPQTRAAAMQAISVTLVFATFSLTRQQAIRLGRIAAGLLLLSMGATLAWRGAAFSFGRDAAPALVGAMIMLATARPLSHFCTMRQALSDQRDQLQRLMRQAQEQATRDELTSLINRRHLSELATQALSRHQRSGTPLSVAVLDLDHFKRVNDDCGHHIGDEVLQSMARLLADTLRATDLLARWGGEEFVALLPDATAADAKVVIDRFLHTLSETMVSSSLPLLRLTCSAGVTQWQPGEPLNTLVERADRALYAAKANGRKHCAMV